MENSSAQEIDHNPSSPEDQLKWCYIYLGKTSRSFAAVIQALNGEIRDAVCIFYLALRALDTIEDDTTVAKETRVPLLNEFHTYLFKDDFSFSQFQYGDNLDERTLLSHFEVAVKVFRRLSPMYQEVIADITERMGKGMAEFIEREVISMNDYDLYCHYVAGLVGIGLSNLFAASGLEDIKFRSMEDISNSMGLCLQKTNIIRDYREDIDQARIFWPRAVWIKYASKLDEFKDPKNEQQALRCLNELISDAVQHLPDCLDYMDQLKDQSVFNFCAIPQVMAIATLSLCYQNRDVFLTNVKMNRQETERIIVDLAMNGRKALYQHVYFYINQMLSKVPFNDPNKDKIVEALTKARRMIEERNDAQSLNAKL